MFTKCRRTCQNQTKTEKSFLLSIPKLVDCCRVLSLYNLKNSLIFMKRHIYREYIYGSIESEWTYVCTCNSVGLRHCIGFLDLENLLSLRWAEDWRLKDSFRASVAADSSLELVLEVWNLISLPLWCWPPPAESSSLKVDWPLNLPLVFSFEIWKKKWENIIMQNISIYFSFF